ncbi:Hypothetical_protein [Hexamita inflata]|uniref:Hypothetical_protein n=1 Tax=Hexamita inflata TaxID=28002 RepID=A0AA86Q040_9EUKA|nr:Hypothetical protein HINF_LOCUS31642 [Hexamita inflata]
MLCRPEQVKLSNLKMDLNQIVGQQNQITFVNCKFINLDGVRDNLVEAVQVKIFNDKHQQFCYNAFKSENISVSNGIVTHISCSKSVSMHKSIIDLDSYSFVTEHLIFFKLQVQAVQPFIISEYCNYLDSI